MKCFICDADLTPPGSTTHMRKLTIAAHFWFHHLGSSGNGIGSICWCGRELGQLQQVMPHFRQDHGGDTLEHFYTAYHAYLLGVTP